MRQLRLIQESPFADGASNMAADCAILEAVAASAQPPTLRLYGWDPFCMSLGYGQRLRDVDADQLAARGWDLVRRPTGGKAILHGDELTYSLCLPLDHPLAAGSVVDSYRRISQGLLCALQQLGLPVESAPESPIRRRADLGPVCFEASSHYEITIGGRKLVGSAQMRRKRAILQHGTIPLFGDVARICDALAFESIDARERQKRHLRRLAAALSDVMEDPPAWAVVADAMASGFRDAFGMALAESELSSDERARLHELKAERFANPQWTAKR